jgi:hypothetical protein
MMPSAGDSAERVVPRIGTGLPSWFVMRRPSGADELSLQGVDTRSAVALLDRLVDPPFPCAKLAASDRDALLASLHRSIWGDRIIASLQCEECQAMYDISFALSALQQQLKADRVSAQATGELQIRDERDRVYRLPDAIQEEECAVAGSLEGKARLIELIGGGGEAEDLEARLEELAPLIDVDLDAPCAECAHPGTARFDVQTFTLQRLLDERATVLGEVHTIAAGYGWALDAILGLDRDTRRAFTQRLTLNAV